MTDELLRIIVELALRLIIFMIDLKGTKGKGRGKLSFRYLHDKLKKRHPKIQVFRLDGHQSRKVTFSEAF